MKRNLYKLINEQFSISDINFEHDEQEYNVNIFNKEANHPYLQKILDGTVTESEIKELNSLIGVAAPKNKTELKKIIRFYSSRYSKDSLNWLSVSGITNMSKLFENSKYNGDIGKWDTSNVTDMSCMFYHASKFNQKIDRWDVSSVTDMSYMFQFAYNFNQPIGKWDVSNVINMKNMFLFAKSFDQDISKWNISDKTNIDDMFFNCNIYRRHKPKKA